MRRTPVWKKKWEGLHSTTRGQTLTSRHSNMRDTTTCVQFSTSLCQTYTQPLAVAVTPVNLPAVNTSCTPTTGEGSETELEKKMDCFESLHFNRKWNVYTLNPEMKSPYSREKKSRRSAFIFLGHCWLHISRFFNKLIQCKCCLIALLIGSVLFKSVGREVWLFPFYKQPKSQVKWRTLSLA